MSAVQRLPITAAARPTGQFKSTASAMGPDRETSHQTQVTIILQVTTIYVSCRNDRKDFTMSQSPNFLAPCLLVIDLIVVAILLTVLGLALGRTQLPSTARTRTWLAVTAASLVWYGLVSYLSVQGVFQATPEVKFPAILLAVFLPIIVGLWLIVRS